MSQPETLAPGSPTAIRPNDRCWKCAYSLHTLDPATGICPECGTPAADSLGFLLRNAPPRYVRRVALALRLMIIATILKCIVFSALAVLIAAELFRWFQLTAWVDRLEPWWPLFGCFCFGAWALGWIGAWRFAEPDVSVTGARASGWFRARIRSATLLHAVLACILAALMIFEDSMALQRLQVRPYGTYFEVAGIIAVILFVGSGALLDFSVLTHARWLARRVPDRRLVRILGALRWVSSTALVALMWLGAVPTTIALGLVAFRLRRRILRATAPTPLAPEGPSA